MERDRIAPLSQYITAYQLKLLGHILRTNNDDLTHDVTFTGGWGRRGFSGTARRGRKRPRWIGTVPQAAWQRIHEDPDSAPIHLDPHNRPILTDDAPFNPHFHSNPFAFPHFPRPLILSHFVSSHSIAIIGEQPWCVRPRALILPPQAGWTHRGMIARMACKKMTGLLSIILCRG